MLLLDVVLGIYFTLYWLFYQLGIFCVQAGEFGELIWCSGPPGSFFPLPQESGSLAVISPQESIIDFVFYYAVIYTKLVYVMPLLLSIMAIFMGLKLVRAGKETRYADGEMAMFPVENEVEKIKHQGLVSNYNQMGDS